MHARPATFRLDRRSPLWDGLYLAALGGRHSAGSAIVADDGPLALHGSLVTSDPAGHWYWSETLRRWSLDFGQVNTDYASFPVTATGDLTLAMWMRLPYAVKTTWTESGLWGLRVAGVTRAMCYGRTDMGGVLVYVPATGKYIRPAAAPAVNLWHHYAWHFPSGAGTPRLWVDGVESGTLVTGTDTAPNYSGLQLGRAYHTIYGPPRLADVMLWQGLLPEPLIARIADPGNVSLSGLVATRPKKARYSRPPDLLSGTPGVSHAAWYQAGSEAFESFVPMRSAESYTAGATAIQGVS